MKLLTNTLLLLVCALLLSSASGCAGKMKYKIRGRIVDGDTGKPVEGAVVAVRWFGYDHWPLGFEGSTGVDYDEDEDVSDADGYFDMIRYWATSYYMGIYKKGYVCWMNDKVFPGWEWRKDFRMKDDMVIKLEPFRESYSKADHARFVLSSMNRCVGIHASGSKFCRSVESERRLFFDMKENEE